MCRGIVVQINFFSHIILGAIRKVEKRWLTPFEPKLSARTDNRMLCVRDVDPNFHVFVYFWLESTPGSTYPTWSVSVSNLWRIDRVFDVVNPSDMEIYRLLATGWWGNQAFSHMNCIVPSRDTSGHSTAIFDEFLLVRFSADAARKEHKIQSFAKS